MTAEKNDAPPTAAAYKTQRVVLLFAADTDAAEDLRALLSLPDGRPLHPSPEGPGRGEQEPWSDEEARAFAWTLLGRLAGKIEMGAAVIVPDVR